MPGPISIEDACTSSIGSVPAETHSSAAITYFSALGWFAHSTARTVTSRRSTHVSSDDLSSLEAAAVHVSVEGSKIAVSVVSMLPASSRPPGRTQHGASPTSDQPGGDAISTQESIVG